MISSKKDFLFIVILLISTLISSIEFEYENTWTRYTLYKKGIEIYNNLLFVNAYCAIEIYTIDDTGNIDLFNVLEFNSLVRDLQIDDIDQMLYIHTSDYIEDGFDRIYAYRISGENLTLDFTTEDVEKFIDNKDLIYILTDYVILGQPDILPCYNKQTQLLEIVNYPYEEIIGSYNNILIEYSIDDTLINFYRIEDINNPILLSSQQYEINSYSRSYVRNFDPFHCLIIDQEEIKIFNTTDEQNIFFETYWTLNFSGIIYEPILVNNQVLYFGSSEGDNFVLDITNYNSPIVLHNWIEDESDLLGYCNMNNFLYCSENGNGIWFYDLSNLPDTDYEENGEPFPFLSTAYLDGYIYKNTQNKLYRINPETNQEEFLCDVPFDIGWDYYKFGNILIIYINYGWDEEYYCAIIDLSSNQLMNYVSLNGQLLIARENRLVILIDQTIAVYGINNNYELEYLDNFETSYNVQVTEFDENQVWISDDNGDFLYNTLDLIIDYDFGNFFSPNPDKLIKPFKYDSRLITSDANPIINESIVSLYDITSLGNPILLDTKSENNTYNYVKLDNYILESCLTNPVRIYNLFDNDFTEPIQEHNFDTAIFELLIDANHNRIINSSSFYNFKTFKYCLTNNTINNFNKDKIILFNHPNPFYLNTKINFYVLNDSFVKLLIYNIKGQLIQSLINIQLQKGNHSVTWNGTDFNGNPVQSGLYLYQIYFSGTPQYSNKCILLK